MVSSEDTSKRSTYNFKASTYYDGHVPRHVNVGKRLDLLASVTLFGWAQSHKKFPELSELFATDSDMD